MLIVAIARAKNEADIIEAFVRHTLGVAQRLIVLDNGSSDGTLGILRALCAEGLALDVLEDPSPGVHQAERMTMLMREYAVQRYAADWVLPLDADEFIGTCDGCLISPDCSQERVLALPWRSYVPEQDATTAEPNAVVRITHRLKEEAWRWTKVLIPGKLASQSEARILPGTHHFSVGGEITQGVPFPTAFLAHFPIRSLGQYLAKIAISKLQYLTVPNRPADWGWHHRAAYEQFKREPGALNGALHDAACRYAYPGDKPICTDTVHDPIIYLGGPLRYTRVGDDHWRPLQAVTAFAEDLAHRYAGISSALDGQDELSAEALAGNLSELHRRLVKQADQLREQGAASAHQCAELNRAMSLLESRESELAALRCRNAELESRLHEQGGKVRGLDVALRHEQGQSHAKDLAYRSLRSSWTWRSGRMLVGPATWIGKTISRIPLRSRQNKTAADQRG